VSAVDRYATVVRRRQKRPGREARALLICDEPRRPRPP
jgi:hypothetical protein